MKRKYFLYAFALTVLPLQAQDIYKVEQFSGEDLNGTARFVGMGGAMNALGADLSAIGTTRHLSVCFDVTMCLCQVA